jgi:cysteinyl-tRNA synthetase
LNITDVDDKILNAASSNDVDPIQLARKYEKEFWKDWDDLNCLRPHIVTRVTEHVASHIVPFIERLVRTNMAYETDDGVYFNVRSYNEQLHTVTKYGKLAPPSAAQDITIDLRNNETANITTATTIQSSQKQDPRDFVLWKKRKPGEALYWSSPWGEGRPGWHIECSAMIQAVQEQFEETHQFLVHAGGIDLKFPHHTNEIAQSEAYLGVGAWIPHWVHTGHLHIDGLKMSKSLKNFVTVREFLDDKPRQNDNDDDQVETATACNQHTLECRADDFRLWCLGLSGSYRGPATFSKTRMDEARTIRQKIVRFLIEGETWIRCNEESAFDGVKKWHDEEHDLFNKVEGSKRAGLLALENDLDGSTFLSELIRIVDSGISYMAKRQEGPTEAMISVLRDVRETLRLVGFTRSTTEAGLISKDPTSGENHVVGGEVALIEELARFRSAVRQTALKAIKGEHGDDSASLKELLRLSDEMRDISLPEIGLQLVDRDGNSHGERDSWKLCLPRKLGKNNDAMESHSQQAAPSNQFDILSIPLSDFFKVGQYEGMFSAYSDEDGMPTHNADGTEVSKRLRKKLSKKWDAHRQRLLKSTT